MRGLRAGSVITARNNDCRFAWCAATQEPSPALRGKVGWGSGRRKIAQRFTCAPTPIRLPPQSGGREGRLLRRLHLGGRFGDAVAGHELLDDAVEVFPVGLAEAVVADDERSAGVELLVLL